MNKIMTLLICLLFAASFSFAQEVKTGPKMSGYIFGDYYYKIGGDPSISGNSSQYGGDKKDVQAFALRRMYLNFDYVFNAQFAGKIVLEAGDKTPDTAKRYTPFVKYAYFEWKEILPGAKLLVGLIPTSEYAAGLAEKGWIYRSVERTTFDKSGLATGADFGVGLYGKIDDKGLFNYLAMIGNGTGVKLETNKYKKYYLSVNAQPIQGLFAEIHYDFEPFDFGYNKTTYKGLLFYKTDAFIFGAEAFMRQQITSTVDNGGKDAKKTPFGLSVYGSSKIMDNLSLFARFDNFNPDKEITNSGYTENFLTAGIDFMPIPDVHIMPNVWITTFTGKEGVTTEKKADMVARLTFFVNFK